MFVPVRMRRNRVDEWIRDITSEVSLQPSDLILPMFVIEGIGQSSEIHNMPGVFRLSMDLILEKIKEAASVGIRAVALFPCVNQRDKTPDGENAYDDSNLLNSTVKYLRDHGVGKEIKIGIICDVALDPYTIHGHDGIVRNGDIDNDLTVDALKKQALSLARMGVDIVSPSDMMDGRVAAIREALDKEGFTRIGILSYAAKYASYFYGPFRTALGTDNVQRGSDVPKDKKTYQMDFRNVNEALREIRLDIAEGADMIMIKPGGPYLDVIRVARDNFDIPIIAYQVSGEYSMIKLAGAAGAIDGDMAMIEALTGMKRAGANGIFCYAAVEVAKNIKV